MIAWRGAFAAALVSSSLMAGGSSAPAVRAGRLQGALHLDGRLDEPSWQEAGIITDLTQQSPRPGAPTPYRTEVRLLVDDEHLYIGLKATDPQPERIAIHTMLRDGDMEGDDSLAIVIDTFRDARTGYLFRINAAGARQDGLISSAGSYSLDWDGIWDARAQRQPDGWSAEIVIPAQTLRFAAGGESWGFNVERSIARERLIERWSGASLDVALNDLSRAGELQGVGSLRQGLGLAISPYGLSRWDRSFPGDERVLQGDGGLDVTYRLTPELSSVLTINTDFAETEVDTRQINLTRFDLFFPEKRGFFLEGANQFEFGTGLDTNFIPFYSRRVGLEAPIDAGIKVLGRAGRWGIGVLDARTGRSDTDPNLDEANLFAARLTFDATEHLRLGNILTYGDPDGSSDNAVAGLDAVWHTSTLGDGKSFTASGWAAGSRGDRQPGVSGGRGGGGFKIDYPNDRWDMALSVNQFGEALHPALGFVPRPGTRFYDAGVAFQPRPTGASSSWVRQWFFELFPERVDNLSGFTESWSIFMAPFNVETQSGEHLEANWEPRFERLAQDTEIAGVLIPAGSYRFDRYRAEAQSSSFRPWGAGTTVWFGGFFDGRLTQLTQYATWASRASHVSFRLERESDTGRLREGEIAERLWRLSAVYAFTPSLIVSSFAQYDADSLGLNNRLRWTLRPGTDLFAVWNRNWKDLDVAGDGRFNALHAASDQVVVKLRWTFTR